MKKLMALMICIIAFAFYLICFWNITPEVAKQKQNEDYVVVHVENPKDYAEVYRSIRKRW